MQELRLVAVSEDGSYAVLVVPGRSGRFALPIDERLRTVARGQFSRLAQYEIEVESPLRPKEIQDRIRAGETAEEIADVAGLPVERIRRFEGPVLAEREYQATQAQRATVRAPGESGPGQRLGDVVGLRLTDLGASSEDQEWDSRKRQDGNWQVQLAYTVAGRMYVAEWVYDPKSKHVTPADDEAIRLSLDETHWPEPRSIGSAGKATVTPIGSRLAGHHPAEHRADADRTDRAGRTLQHPSRGTSVTAPVTSHPQPAPPPVQAPAPSSPPEAPPAPAEPVPPQAEEPQSAPVHQPAAERQDSDSEEASREPAPPVAPEPREREPEQAPRPARRASGSRSRRSSAPARPGPMSVGGTGCPHRIRAQGRAIDQVRGRCLAGYVRRVGVMRRLAILAAVIPLVSGCGVLDGLSDTRLNSPDSITVTSPVFGSNVELPRIYTCHGRPGVSPPLQWSGTVSPAPKSYAIVVDDSDAPINPYVYWLVFDLSPNTVAIGQHQLPTGAKQAENSAGRAAYDPPCPQGKGHAYRFTVYALNAWIKLPSGVGLRMAWSAIASHVVASGRLTSGT